MAKPSLNALELGFEYWTNGSFTMGLKMMFCILQFAQGVCLEEKLATMLEHLRPVWRLVIHVQHLHLLAQEAVKNRHFNYFVRKLHSVRARVVWAHRVACYSTLKKQSFGTWCGPPWCTVKELRVHCSFLRPLSDKMIYHHNFTREQAVVGSSHTLTSRAEDNTQVKMPAPVSKNGSFFCESEI